MGALVITAESRRRIAELRAHAAADVITVARAWRMKSGSEPPTGNDPRCRMELPVGFLVVYSIAETPDGQYAHLSVSVSEEGRIPHPLSVEMLLTEFGMPGLYDCDNVWEEAVGTGRRAINVVAKLREEAPKL